MARADAEIEATFRLYNEDVILGRLLDRHAILDNMNNKHRRRAEAQRRYREAQPGIRSQRASGSCEITDYLWG